jgi:hypothetical protein
MKAIQLGKHASVSCYILPRDLKHLTEAARTSSSSILRGLTYRNLLKVHIAGTHVLWGIHIPTDCSGPAVVGKLRRGKMGKIYGARPTYGNGSGKQAALAPNHLRELSGPDALLIGPCTSGNAI